MVEDVDRGETVDAPACADRPPWLSVPPAAPGNLAGGDRFLERLPGLVGVYAQESERLVLESLDELSLLRIHRPARAAPIPGEGEHDDFASIIAQPERPAVSVFAFDVRGGLPARGRGQPPRCRGTVLLVQLPFGEFPEGSVPIISEIRELGDDLLEQSLGLLEQIIGTTRHEGGAVLGRHLRDQRIARVLSRCSRRASARKRTKFASANVACPLTSPVRRPGDRLAEESLGQHRVRHDIALAAVRAGRDEPIAREVVARQDLPRLARLGTEAVAGQPEQASSTAADSRECSRARARARFAEAVRDLQVLGLERLPGLVGGRRGVVLPELPREALQSRTRARACSAPGESGPSVAGLRRIRARDRRCDMAWTSDRRTHHELGWAETGDQPTQLSEPIEESQPRGTPSVSKQGEDATSNT